VRTIYRYRWNIAATLTAPMGEVLRVEHVENKGWQMEVEMWMLLRGDELAAEYTVLGTGVTLDDDRVPEIVGSTGRDRDGYVWHVARRVAP
jgi:hypothetical protein